MLKLNKASLVVSSLVHAAMLCHHVVLVMGFASIDIDLFDHPVVMRMKPFKYLTISGWCLKFQMDHIVLSLIVEWQHWRGDKADLEMIAKYVRYKDVLFRGLVLPSTLMISFLFWLLYAIDRELIYPSLWDKVVSGWLNHGIHTSTALFTIIELMKKRGSGERNLEWKLYWTLYIGYAALMSTLYVKYEFWLYPFLWRLSGPQLCIFLLAFSSLGQLILEAVWWLDRVPRRIKVE